MTKAAKKTSAPRKPAAVPPTPRRLPKQFRLPDGLLVCCSYENLIVRLRLYGWRSDKWGDETLLDDITLHGHDWTRAQVEEVIRKMLVTYRVAREEGRKSLQADLAELLGTAVLRDEVASLAAQLNG